jgi:endoglucanase
MKELIMQLAEACAPAGNEDNVRALLKEAVAPYADEVREDVIGNLIATKKGTGADRKQLLLTAHMDEPGLLVVYVEESGLLRVGPIAAGEAAYWVGKRIVFPNGTAGVVATEAKTPGDVQFSNLVVDIGAASKAEATSHVQVGDSCSLEQSATALLENRLTGKALDNRVGCAVAVEVLKQLGDATHDVTVVFAVQQQVGNRGIKPSAFSVEPDFGLVLDGVRSGDTPGAGRLEIKLGEGAAIKVMDGRVLIPGHIKNFLIDQAEAADLKYQLEVNPEGQSDAGALLQVQAGVPVGALSIPFRQAGLGAEIVDLRDVEATVTLAVAALKNYNL